MQKSRLGIGLGLLCSGLYFLGILNMVAFIIVAGYVLLFETNEWLKKNALTALKIVIGFSLIPFALDLINDIIAVGKMLFTSGEESSYDSLDSISKMLEGKGSDGTGSQLQELIRMAAEIAKNAMLFFFGFKALSATNNSSNNPTNVSGNSGNSGNSTENTQSGNM